MKALLQLQRFGLATLIAPGSLEMVVYGTPGKYRDWVAEITGADAKYGYSRRFLRPQIDYARADVDAARGTTANYILDEGPIYDVREQVDYWEYIRYFCAVRDGEVVKISAKEVSECLRSRLELTSAPRPANV